MDYKLVVCDCDNTLIDSRGYIPKDNIRAIRKIMEKGVKFVIATGRNDLLVLDYANEIGGDITLIGCNGATIRNINKGITYRNELIPKDSLKKIFDCLDENEFGFKAYTIDKSFVRGLDLGNKIRRLTGSYYENVKDFEVTPIKYGEEIINEGVLKVVAIDKKEELLKIQNALRGTKGINVVFSAEVCLDMISEKASKGSAMLKLAEELGISLSEIAAFGDSENDLSMLTGAGLSVCMENGTEEVKKHCKMITKTNNEAGVAIALDKIFGLNMY
ncbi:MAG: HAD family hydrolase [Clostridiales bacterium]|nr:HAD family hydrolase [Clostridiales bacterium]